MSTPCMRDVAPRVMWCPTFLMCRPELLLGPRPGWTAGFHKEKWAANFFSARLCGLSGPAPRAPPVPVGSPVLAPVLSAHGQAGPCESPASPCTSRSKTEAWSAPQSPTGGCLADKLSPEIGPAATRTALPSNELLGHVDHHRQSHLLPRRRDREGRANFTETNAKAHRPPPCRNGSSQGFSANSLFLPLSHALKSSRTWARS